MARMIRIDRSVPYKIEPKDFPPDGKSIWICGCGLSNKMPYCDQTHKTCCPAEQTGTLYTYDATSKQVIRTQADDAPRERT